ncbi:MAG: DNA repair protein RadC [Myxococcales bacterium]|nr:DNA repair protein RadC [Myxococcales bacterium]
MGPRERLLLHGEACLSDSQLLAVLLGTGSSREGVAVLAERLIGELGGLEGLRRTSAASLSLRAGIGHSKASRLRAAVELGLRLSARPLHPKAPVSSSRDVEAALGPRLRQASQEHFYALPLDAKNRPLAEILVAIGGLSSCAVTPSDIFRQVLREPAASVIFAHNHPSGEPAPSDEDVAITGRLCRAGALLGLGVLDHIIIGHQGYFSFLDAGMLK